MATLQHSRGAVAADSAVGPPSNVHDTQGEKEDFSDIIGLIAPYDTPVYSTLRKVDAVAPVIHWQEDDLAAAASNPVAEGATVTIAAQTSPGISINYTQLFEKTASVSSTAEATQWYGRASEMDYQIMKRGREMKRDVEFALVGSGAAAAEGSSDGEGGITARTMGSAESLISSGNSKALGAATNVTEADVLEKHQDCYDNGGDPNWMLVSPGTSTVVANFAYIDPTTTSSNGARQRQTEGNRLVNIVEIYQSPFGTMTVVTDKFIEGAAGASGDETGVSLLLLETDRWAIPVLQPMQVEDLAKVSHSEDKLVSCELSLLHENENSSAIITNIDTTA